MYTTNSPTATGMGPTVLLVVAHPDDEYYCAATIYRLTNELGGSVDQLIITNGEGGFRYSSLAERLYGASLCNEADGRATLPAIRKQEVARAGRILGIRRHYFLDQRDGRFTLDLEEPFHDGWDRTFIERQLDHRLAVGGYDFVLTLLPTLDTHGHHKAATLLALEAAMRLPEDRRPIVLGCAFRSSTDSGITSYSMLPHFPITRSRYVEPMFSFDRTARFGPRLVLDYSIVVHWMIAEHKSQGFFQTTYGQHDLEEFWYFAMNGVAGLRPARQFFDALQPPVHAGGRLRVAA